MRLPILNSGSRKGILLLVKWAFFKKNSFNKTRNVKILKKFYPGKQEFIE
jgi:hypothetical protein